MHKYEEKNKKILDLYQNFPPYFRSAEEEKSSEEAFGFVKQSLMPETLYRFRPLDHDDKIDQEIEAIKNGRLYLSSMNRFNDPFEASFHWGSLYQKKMDSIAVERNAFLSFQTPEVQAQLVEDWNNEMHEDHNMQRNKMREKIRNNYKVSCFSECHNSILMWSHYANQHKGICLEFSMKKVELEIRKRIFPVAYHQNMFNLSDYLDEESSANCIKNQKYPFLCLFLKDIGWIYENEWRYAIQDLDDTKEVTPHVV